MAGSSTWLGRKVFNLEKMVRFRHLLQNKIGVVVQLARTPALQAGGRGFDYRQLHQKSSLINWGYLGFDC